MAEASASPLSWKPSDMSHLGVEKEDDARTVSTKASDDESASGHSAGCASSASCVSGCSFFSNDSSGALSITHAFRVLTSEAISFFTGKSENNDHIHYVTTHPTDASDYSSVASATSSVAPFPQEKLGIKHLYGPPALRCLAEGQESSAVTEPAALMDADEKVENTPKESTGPASDATDLLFMSEDANKVPIKDASRYVDGQECSMVTKPITLVDADESQTVPPEGTTNEGGDDADLSPTPEDDPSTKNKSFMSFFGNLFGSASAAKEPVVTGTEDDGDQELDSVEESTTMQSADESPIPTVEANNEGGNVVDLLSKTEETETPLVENKSPPTWAFFRNLFRSTPATCATVTKEDKESEMNFNDTTRSAFVVAETEASKTPDTVECADTSEIIPISSADEKETPQTRGNETGSTFGFPFGMTSDSGTRTPLEPQDDSESRFNDDRNFRPSSLVEQDSGSLILMASDDAESCVKSPSAANTAYMSEEENAVLSMEATVCKASEDFNTSDNLTDDQALSMGDYSFVLHDEVTIVKEDGLDKVASGASKTLLSLRAASEAGEETTELPPSDTTEGIGVDEAKDATTEMPSPHSMEVFGVAESKDTTTEMKSPCAEVDSGEEQLHSEEPLPNTEEHSTDVSTSAIGKPIDVTASRVSAFPTNKGSQVEAEESTKTNTQNDTQENLEESTSANEIEHSLSASENSSTVVGTCSESAADGNSTVDNFISKSLCKLGKSMSAIREKQLTGPKERGDSAEDKEGCSVEKASLASNAKETPPVLQKEESDNAVAINGAISDLISSLTVFNFFDIGATYLRNDVNDGHEIGTRFRAITSRNTLKTMKARILVLLNRKKGEKKLFR